MQYDQTGLFLCVVVAVLLLLKTLDFHSFSAWITISHAQITKYSLDIPGNIIIMIVP